MTWLPRIIRLDRMVAEFRRCLAYGIFFYAWVVYRTARWQFVNEEHKSKAVEHGRVMYSFWHTNIVCWYCSVRFEDPHNIVNLTLGGKTAQILEPICRLYGTKPVFTCPDDDAQKNARAVAQILKHMRAGMNSFIAPDGPVGPAYDMKGGVADITKRIGGVILPLGLRPAWYIRLRRWDKAILPIPFTKFRVIYGEPIFVNRKSNTGEVMTKLEETLNSCLGDLHSSSSSPSGC